jgi:hypothetical protein
MIFSLLNFPAPDSRTLKGGTGLEPVSLGGLSPARRRPVGSPREESVRSADRMPGCPPAAPAVPQLR